VLDSFYLIVDSAAWIARLLPCGVRLVQLRIKDKPDATLRAEIEESKALCERHGAKLVVNDHWRQAIDAGCNFVHLGQGDLATADLAAIRRAGIKFGVSTHDEAELSRALVTRPDYIALGPVYPTILKAMTFAPQGLPRLAEWKKKIGKIPLVGIGGITLARVAGVLQAGADSAAVVTDVSRNADPEQRTRDWVKATRAFAKMGAKALNKPVKPRFARLP
jgi:thiamine-phosphate pyrophosphorylase